MEKPTSKKKLDFKKSLVRHPQQTVPKTVVIHQPEISDPSPILEKTSASTIELTSQAELGVPELYSVLNFVRKIDNIEHKRQRKPNKCISEVDNKRGSTNEKASKQLNFPYNQAIYKDLIPLCVKTKSQPLPTMSREIVVHKDKEPSLSDFFTPRTLPEYSFQVPIQAKQNVLNKQYDGFKLYRTIRNWN